MTSHDERQPRRPLATWLQHIATFPLDVLRFVLELAVRPRALILAFFVAAMVFATAGWLRPPLSPDIRPQHVPLHVHGLFQATDAPSLLATPRQSPLVSVGNIVLGVLAVAGVISFVWPRRFALCAGSSLAIAIAANAVLGLNYPTLIDRMDTEEEERQNIALVLVALDANSISNGGDPRVLISVATPPLRRGYDYLLYGPWLVTWAALGLVVGARGSIGTRLAWTMFAGACGIALATGACWPRLAGEFHFANAVRLESRGEWSAARRALQDAVDACPDLDPLWRTHRLRGLLDFRDGQTTADEQLWQIDQWLRNDEHPKAVAFMNGRLAGTNADPTSDGLAARLFTQAGLALWAEGRGAPAAELWRRAADLDPRRCDTGFLLSTVQSRFDRSRPELVSAELSPLVQRMADRVLRADILADLGDAYFDAGQFEAARQRYSESLRSFELPKDINYRARKGLVGM